MFEILSKTNEIDTLCATITNEIKLENPESSNRKRLHAFYFYVFVKFI